MLISIIIPVFNAAKTIDATVQSALQQQSKNYEIEIIIINDGSTDNTVEVLRRYKNNCLIITQNNTGVSVARQNGFELSRGNFIQYLDSDDLLHPGKFEIQMQALIIQRADIAYGDFERFSENNNTITVEGLVTGEIKGNPEIEIFRNFWRPPAAILYSRQVVEKISWSATLPVIQDARYFLDAVFTGGKLVYTPGVQAKYRINQNSSLSQRSNHDFLKDCFQNAVEVYAIWKKELVKEAEKKSALINVLRFCIHEFSLVDQHLFYQAINLLLEIAPGYIPEKSLSLNLTSRIFGYRNAERIAALKRKI